MRRNIFGLVLFIFTAIVYWSCNYRSTVSASSLNDSIPFGVHTQFFFCGNFIYTPESAYLEELITGHSMPVEMTGVPYMIETEYPRIAELSGTPLYVELKGYMVHAADSTGRDQLVISKILDYQEQPQSLEVMMGGFKASTRLLFLYPNHTFKMTDLSSSIIRTKEGKWFLNSRDLMSLFSGNTETVKRINYKKKTLNKRDEDTPEIFILTQPSH